MRALRRIEPLLQPGGLGRLLAQAHMGGAGDEEQHAQRYLNQRQPAAGGRVAPAAHHAFGEVQPHQQAHPAIGVHAALEQTNHCKGQRQRLEEEQRAAGAQGRKPQLPGHAQHHQRKQTANGQPACGGHIGAGLIDW